MSTNENVLYSAKQEDYTLYKVGSRWKCIPRDIDDTRYTGTVPETVLQSAIDERLTQGGIYAINDNIDELKSTIYINDTSVANHIWEFKGRDRRLTGITAHADLGANEMFHLDRSVGNWVDQDPTTIRLRDLTINPNDIASTCVYAPYSLGEFRGSVYFERLVGAGDDNVVGRIGGSGGPGTMCTWDNVICHYVGANENVTAFDVWYDRLRIAGLQIDLKGSSTGCRGLYMNGEHLSIGHLGSFASPGSTGILLDLAGSYASVNQIVMNDGGANMSLVRCNSTAYCNVGQARYSGSNVLWHDAQTSTNSVVAQDLNI